MAKECLVASKIEGACDLLGEAAALDEPDLKREEVPISLNLVLRLVRLGLDNLRRIRIELQGCGRATKWSLKR